MPQIIPLVVTAITTVTSAVVAAGPLAVAAFNTVNVIGAGMLANAAFGVLQPEVKSSSTAIEWNADPNAPNRFPFGRVGGAGNIIHNATYGPDKMFVSFVGVMGSSGPIRSWVGFRADDQPVSFDGSGKANSTQYANVMWLSRQLGRQPETSALSSPSGLKNGATLPGWGSSYRLSGKAAFVYTLSENSKRSAYGGKVPTPINTIEGLYCYDPRYDSSYPGGSGSCRLNNPATWVYSTNGPIHGLNWAIGRWEGLTSGAAGAPYASMKVGGIGASPEGIDFAAYVEAANVFDENRWACAAWPDADQSKASVLDSFLQASGAIYAERQGRISCVHRAAPRTSIVTITTDDTAGTIEYDTTTSLLERINTIRPKYWSEAHDWQMVETLQEVTSSVWREEDGQGVAVTKSKGVDFNYVPGSKQVRELAALQIGHTREGIKGTAPLRHYLDLDVGDCFTWDVPEAVLNGLKCIVLNVDPDLENDIINVTFCSESDGKYPFAFGQAASPPPAPAIVPRDLTYVAPPLPGDWTLSSEVFVDGGVPVPTLLITGAVDNDTADAVLFEYRVVGATTWTPKGQETPGTTRMEITGLTNLTGYEVAVSYRRGNNFSDRLVLGPVISGSALPITSVIGAGVTLIPATPLSAGSPPDTSINVAATSATLLGGQILNLPSATIAGLSADTTYAVFRDLQTNTYVAASTNLSSYFSALGRYLPLGYQTTAVDSGGGYSPPPPPRPGGGGGYCPDVDTPILMMGGATKRAGDLLVGDTVLTMHEASLIWGPARVYAVETYEDNRLTVRAGNREITATPGHRVLVLSRGFVSLSQLQIGDVLGGDEGRSVESITPAGRGYVVRISVEAAQTYVTNGILSHNLKPVELDPFL